MRLQTLRMPYTCDLCKGANFSHVLSEIADPDLRIHWATCMAVRL